MILAKAFMEGKCAVCLALVWHGHIALWHDNGKIRLRARSRSEVPEMEGRGGEEWVGGRTGGCGRARRTLGREQARPEGLPSHTVLTTTDSIFT